MRLGAVVRFGAVVYGEKARKRTNEPAASITAAPPKRRRGWCERRRQNARNRARKEKNTSYRYYIFCSDRN